MRGAVPKAGIGEDTANAGELCGMRGAVVSGHILTAQMVYKGESRVKTWGVAGERVPKGNLEKALEGVAEPIWRQADVGVCGVTAAGEFRRTKIHFDSGSMIPNKRRKEIPLIVGILLTWGFPSFHKKAAEKSKTNSRAQRFNLVSVCILN